jgi:hypothetical protein
MARRVYCELVIVASSPAIEIWLGDDAGHLVQKEFGELRTSLLPGHYVVSFGLNAPTYPIKLDSANHFTQYQLRNWTNVPAAQAQVATRLETSWCTTARYTGHYSVFTRT